MNKTYTPIERACNAVGGQSSLAEMLGVKPSFVNQWVKGRRKVPAAHCAAIEALSLGAATKQELRPVDWQKYWPELANQPAKTVALTARLPNKPLAEKVSA
jgi:DNA-binding transcriptional regulator YdaS (Cro superfamily)